MTLYDLGIRIAQQRNVPGHLKQAYAGGYAKQIEKQGASGHELRAFDPRNRVSRTMSPSLPPEEFPLIHKALRAGKIKVDPKTGKLYYPHGAPHGKMIRTGPDAWQEAADGYFEPESDQARQADVLSLVKTLRPYSELPPAEDRQDRMPDSDRERIRRLLGLGK